MRARARSAACCAGCVLALLAGTRSARAQPDTLAPDDAPPAQESDRGFAAQLGAGAGVGLRAIRVPTSGGQRRLVSGPFPALEVDLRGEASLAPQLLLGARFRYQTSVGLVGHETPYGGAPRESALRLHHIDAGLEPALRFAPSRTAVVLGLFAGFGLRAVSTIVELTLPDYTLYGPIARLELRVPLGERVLLRLAPELMVWLGASDELRAEGALAPDGLALGGEASLHFELIQALAFELGYRASYGSIASELGGAFRDEEHYATAQVALVW